MSSLRGTFGTKIGPFWWNYNLSAVSRFIDALTPHRELRFYGVTIGEIAIGFFRRVAK